MKVLFAIGPAGVLLVLAPAKAQAKEIHIPAPFTPTETLIDVNTRASSQIDPHLSGDWGSYTDQPGYSVRSGYTAAGSVRHRRK